MVRAESRLRLDALPAEELAKSLSRERLVRAGLSLGAAYFLYNGFLTHDIMEDAFQVVKAQGDGHYEPVYRFAQIGLWVGSLSGASFFARFAHKSHKRVEDLEATPTYAYSNAPQGAAALGEAKYLK